MIPPKNNPAAKEGKRAVFDTNIFLLGIDFNVLPFEEIITSPKVLKEIKSGQKNRNIWHKIEAAIENKKLQIKTASPQSINRVNKESKKTGDMRALSEADVELIALMVELIDEGFHNIVLYTNDYSMQNLCSELEIPFSPLIRKGIKAKIIWEVFCPHCRKVFPPEYLNTICEKCHSQLKRRPKR